MNELDQQLRVYATALLEDSKTRRPSQVDEPRRHRFAFVAAAACLVLVVGLAGVLALGQDEGDGGEGVAATIADGVAVELWLSNIAPAPDEEVIARVTFTNTRDTPAQVPGVCRTTIGLTVDGGFEPHFDSGSEDLDSLLASQASWAPFSSAPLPDLPSLDELQEIYSDPDRFELPASCGPSELTLAPGESTSVTKQLGFGEIGLPPGPGSVSLLTFPIPSEVAVPVTIPEAPVGAVTRADAIALALGEPAVQAMLKQLPELPDAGTARWPEPPVPLQSGVDDPPTPVLPPQPSSDLQGAVLLGPTSEGWSLGYARREGAFLATIDRSGELAVEVRP